MDESRRVELENRLQGILGELGVVCDELGLEVSLQNQEHPKVATNDRAASMLLLAEVGSLNVGFVAEEVDELIRMVELTPPVEPRPELEGFVNVRGKAVLVLNLRYLLDQPQEAHDPAQVLVVLQGARTKLAVIVDEIVDIFPLEGESFQDRDTLDLHRGFIDGVAKIENRLVAVLNPVLLARQVL